MIEQDALFQALRQMSNQDESSIDNNMPDIISDRDDIGNLDKIICLVDAIGRDNPLKDISAKLIAARNSNYLSNDVLIAFSMVDLKDLFNNDEKLFSNGYFNDVLSSFKSMHIISTSRYF